MKKIKWLEKENNLIHRHFYKWDIERLIEKLNSLHDTNPRTEKSITRQASTLGMSNKVSFEKSQKERQAVEYIKTTNYSLKRISLLTGLSRLRIEKLFNANLIVIKNYYEETENKYFRNEEDIFKALQPKYELKDLKGWEKFQVKQTTQKGYECPKLQTRTLNTYK
jgi:hypothetical protein